MFQSFEVTTLILSAKGATWGRSTLCPAGWRSLSEMRTACVWSGKSR